MAPRPSPTCWTRRKVRRRRRSTRSHPTPSWSRSAWAATTSHTTAPRSRAATPRACAPRRRDSTRASRRPRAALKTLIDQVKAAAPKATIVFVTYPREVPAGKNCPALSFTDEEAAIVRSMGEKLEALFVEVVKPTGVVFVDPYVAPGDHTGCAPAAERWTAGHIPDDGFAYHPTALGHQVMAAMIAKALGD